MSETSISQRLRDVRQRHGWTTQEMAEITQVPKRTLDSYMLKENAPLPGLEALQKIAKGLNISLDWLVLGDGFSGERAYGVTRLSARQAALPIIQSLYEAFEQGTPLPSPEYVAMDVGRSAGEMAQALTAYGLSSNVTHRMSEKHDRELEDMLTARMSDLRQQVEGLQREIHRPKASPEKR